MTKRYMIPYKIVSTITRKFTIILAIFARILCFLPLYLFISFYSATKFALEKFGHNRIKSGTFNVYIVVCLSTLHIGAVEAKGRYYKFDIPKNTVNITLGIIAKESDTSLLLPYDKVKSIQANAVKGIYNLKKALSLALANTGLFASVNDDGVIIVKIVEAKKKSYKKTILEPTPVLAAEEGKPLNAESEIEVIQITGTFSGNFKSALNAKKRANVIQDGISADDIGALPALDLGEALQAVPGIQLNREGERRQSSVNLRGLPSGFVMTTANGQSIASPKRSADPLANAYPFGDYEPAIFNGVTVIKSSTADMVEGGISGNIDIKLIRALSAPESALSIKLGSRYEELNDEYDPEFVMSGSKHFYDGKFAVAGTAAWSKQTFRRDTLKINRYEPIQIQNGFDTEAAGQSYDEWLVQQNAEVGLPLDARVEMPSEVRQEVEVNEGDRLSLSLALEWQPTEQLNFGANVLYTDRDMDDNQLQQHILSPRDRRVLINPLDTPRDTGAVTNDGQAVWAVSDIDVRNVMSEHHSRTWDLGSSSQAIIFDGEFQGDDWTLSGAISLSEATSTYDAVIIAQVYKPEYWEVELNPLTARIYTGEGNIGNFVSTLNTSDQDWFNFVGNEWDGPSLIMSDTANVRGTNNRQFTVGGGNETVKREGESVEFSAQRFFDSPISSVKVGYRYLTENTDSYGDRYGAVGIDMRGMPYDYTVPSHYTSGGAFFGGNVPGYIPASTGSAAGWVAFDPESLISQLTATIPDVSTILDDPSNGESAVLTDRGLIVRGKQHGSSLDYDTVIDTHAAFAMANFELELDAMSITGNFGLRYVTSDVTASAPLYDLADVTQVVTYVSGNDYHYLLPSLNISAELSDDLVLRLAYNEGIVRPNLRAILPIAKLSISGNYELGEEQSVDLEVPGTGIDPFEATSIDASLEWYNRDGSAVTFAVFEKDVSNFIATVKSCDNDTLTRTGFSGIIGSLSFNDAGQCITSGVEDSLQAGSEVILTETINITNDITVRGYELSIQQNLDFLPAPWNGLGGVLNYSHTSQSSDADNEVEIAGISEDTYNAIAYFEQKSWGVRLAYNYRSDYLLQSIGTFNGLGNKSVQAAGRLDFAAYYNITEDTKINFKAYNLTESLYEEYQSVKWQPRATHFDGRVFAASIQHRF